MKQLIFGLPRPVGCARKAIAACAAAALLAGCAPASAPSVPQQPGMSFMQAREDVRGCSVYAPKGGKDALIGSYVTGILLAGFIVGPVAVASSEGMIRDGGERRAVDRCLGELGYERRELTPQEISALNSSRGYDRQRLLNYLVAGGTLDTFS